MAHHRLELSVLEGRLAICRLEPGVDVPPWATGCRFVSITRTPEELSILCDESAVPEGVRAEKGYRALRVAGALDFALVGILASLAGPLAEAGVAVFAVSTFDTDYLLIRGPDLARAVGALEAAGHVVGASDRTKPRAGA